MAYIGATDKAHTRTEGTPDGMDELTTITHGEAGYTVVTGWGVTLAADSDRKCALRALFHRGFTPESAVASVNTAARIGTITVAGLVAD